MRNDTEIMLSTSKLIIYILSTSSCVMFVYIFLRFLYLEHTKSGRAFSKARGYGTETLAVCLIALWMFVFELGISLSLFYTKFGSSESESDAAGIVTMPQSVCIAQAMMIDFGHLALTITLALLIHQLYTRLIYDIIPPTRKHAIYAFSFTIICVTLLGIFAEAERLPTYCLFRDPAWFIVLVFYGWVLLSLVCGSYWAYRSIKAIFAVHGGSGLNMHDPNKHHSDRRYVDVYTLYWTDMSVSTV
jgi:hypothetical protein